MTIYRFDQIAQNINSRVMPQPEDSSRYVGLEHLDTDSLQVRRWGTDVTLIGQKMRMQKGDVIFARRNAYLRRVAVAPFDGIFSAHGLVLRAKTDVCLHEFLPIFMQSDYFMERAIKISVGSLSPTINWSALAREEFKLPPLDEQVSIADLLWAFSNSQSSLAETRDAARRLLPSLLHESTSHRPHWKNILLKEIAQIDINKVSVEDGKKYHMCGVLGYGQGVFDNGIADSKSTKYKYLHLLRADQLILRKITAWESPIAIVPLDFDGYFASPEFPTFTLDKSKILPSFMSILYKTQQFRQEMQTRCTGTLVRRMRLNPAELLKISISLPPLDEQQEIVSKLDSLKIALSSIEKHLNSTKELGRSILEKRLFGK